MCSWASLFILSSSFRLLLYPSIVLHCCTVSASTLLIWPLSTAALTAVSWQQHQQLGNSGGGGQRKRLWCLKRTSLCLPSAFAVACHLSVCYSLVCFPLSAELGSGSVSLSVFLSFSLSLSLSFSFCSGCMCGGRRTGTAKHCCGALSRPKSKVDGAVGQRLVYDGSSSRRRRSACFFLSMCSGVPWTLLPHSPALAADTLVQRCRGRRAPSANGFTRTRTWTAKSGQTEQITGRSS